jgi:threonine/homoserine/homoserine lactone efflux protein
MPIALILLFAMTEFLLSLSPGPAVLLVVSQGIRSGARASLLGTAGILIANIFYFGISALGLGAILLTSEILFIIIKWSGALYLIYLGAKMIRDTWLIKPETRDIKPLPSRRRLFRQGLVTQLANPKAIIFFTALLPQFIDAQGAPAYQFLILGIVSVMVEFPILVMYGWLAAKGGNWLKHSKYFKWLDRVAGAFLIGAGAKLAFTEQAA